jgi:hypothetical protein
MSFLDTLGTTIVKGVSDAFSPSSLVTSALSFLGGERRNQQAANSAAAANAFSAQQYANRWQTTVNDMKAAGLNPMLAYSQGVGSAQPSGQMAQFQDTISPAVATFQNQNLQESQASSNYASASQATQNAVLINKTVEKTSAEIKNLGSTYDQIGAMVKNLAQELQNLQDQNANIKMQNDVLKETARKISRESGLIESETALNNTRNAVAGFERDLKQGEVKAMNNLGNFGNEYKQVAPILDLLKDLYGIQHTRTSSSTVNSTVRREK